MAQENDVVLVYFEDEPFMFARIEDIQPDIKPDWYHVKLLMLKLPLQTVTWILRTAYIDGAEYTMNGKRMRLEKVVCPEEPDDDFPEDDDDGSGPKEASKVISFKSRKKK